MVLHVSMLPMFTTGLSHAVEYRCAVFWALLSWGCRAFLPSIFSLAMLLVEAAAYVSDPARTAVFDFLQNIWDCSMGGLTSLIV